MILFSDIMRYKVQTLRNPVTFIQAIHCPKIECAHLRNVCLEMAEGYKITQSNIFSGKTTPLC